jgi:pyruvate dehydrogenase E1 component beta subunit
MAADISALVARKAFAALTAPIEMVTAPHTPVPFSNTLEDLYVPDAQRIANAVKAVAEWAR